jgi:hypothetical protein
MLLPGLLHADGKPASTWMAEARPMSMLHVPQHVLGLTLSLPPAAADSAVGFLPLLLAAFGLLAGRGALARPGRITLALALALALAGRWMPSLAASLPVSAALLIAVALLAGAGLARLDRRVDGREGPAMALGGAAVLLAGLLVAVALKAGAITDARVVQPLLDRSLPGWHRELLARPEVIGWNAAWLRAVLDRAALAGFLSMSVLLLHLKARGVLTASLVLLAVAADLLSVRWLL